MQLESRYKREKVGEMRWVGLYLRTPSCLILPCCLGYTTFGLVNKKAKVIVSEKVEASFQACRDGREYQKGHMLSPTQLIRQ